MLVIISLLVPTLCALLYLSFRAKNVRQRCLERSYEIYCFLSDREAFESSSLLCLSPSARERRELAKLLSVLAHNFADCEPERVRVLSLAWGIEPWLLGRLGSPFVGVQCRALEQLLLLSPSQKALTRVRGCRFHRPATRFLQLLLLVYEKPSQVVVLVKHHPHLLTWEEVGRVVEVLKMRCTVLDEPHREGMATHNTELLLLYMAQVEGVGDVAKIAQELSESHDTPLRQAATNTLLSLHRYPHI